MTTEEKEKLGKELVEIVETIKTIEMTNYEVEIIVEFIESKLSEKDKEIAELKDKIQTLVEQLKATDAIRLSIRLEPTLNGSLIQYINRVELEKAVLTYDAIYCKLQNE